MIRKHLALACAFVTGVVVSGVAAGPLSGPAAAQSRIEVGVLECRGMPSTSFLIGSVQNFNCIFNSASGPPQVYQGQIRKLGVDVGLTERSVLVWTVFAPTRVLGPGSLAGGYVGVAAGAAVGVGLGANALIGGFNNSVALQPVSIEAQQGLNIQVGVAALELR